jgi:hypothetical protein
LNDFEAFNDKAVKYSNTQNHRLQWVVQLVLSSHLPQADFIRTEHVVSTSCKYISELMAVNNWRMALVVCHLIPDTHPLHNNIRCRVTFEVIQNQITEILGEGNFE